MRFITFLVVLVHKFYILVVISLIGKNTHPPFPTYHSIITLEAKPPPPLSLSDMIFERSLTLYGISDVFVQRLSAFLYAR